MFLHAMHTAQAGSTAIVIITEDTDVLVMFISFAHNSSCPLYRKCGKQNRTLFINVGQIIASIGNDICDSLIELHAFTGCDTLSAFAESGNVKALGMIERQESDQKVFSELGKTWEVTTEMFDKIQQLTCHKYASSAKANDVNELRYQLLCAKRVELDSSQLPPSKDCLLMHTLRATYQAAIWRHCLEAQP